MARFRLTAPHYVTRANGVPSYLETGTVIDSAEFPPHWEPTPAMVPLDTDAEVMHTEIVRRAITGARSAEIVGFGHARNLHGGLDHLNATGHGDR